MDVLNLFAGIGGNRKKWTDCHVTAVEHDRKIGEVYRSLYPNDSFFGFEALRFLEKYHPNYDFIWASPPCQSHGQYRHNVGVKAKGYQEIIPEMTSLYGVIIFLDTYFKGKWVVENTIPYYKPLINPIAKIGRHVFWSNFEISDFDPKPKNIRYKNKISDFENGRLIESAKIKNKRQVLRNCVDSDLGKHIFDCMIRSKK
jgi:DNA (cytosine-5)-methyltransferase 1